MNLTDDIDLSCLSDVELLTVAHAEAVAAHAAGLVIGPPLGDLAVPLGDLVLAGALRRARRADTDRRRLFSDEAPGDAA
jgi:hypothetical protein